MADQGFPSQHTTTTTVTASSTRVQPNLRLDTDYLKTRSGSLKIVQVALDFLGFLCISISGYALTSQGNFFDFVTVFGFWFTGILLVLYVFHVVEKFFKIPWIKIELVFCGVWTIFYLIGSTFVAGLMSYSAAMGVAAFFGYLAMIAYGYDAFLKYQAMINGELAQGERHVSRTTTSTVTTPAY
uniref:MARVEL domain-containing protein n=1 Tax=Clastoptera arizonana TaxID=38151 RepID=A0A1B6CLX8_9HEMI